MSTFLNPEIESPLINTILNYTSEGIVLSDSQNQIILVNKAFTQIMGYTSEEIVGKQGSFLRSGYHDDSFFENLWLKLHSQNHWEGEIWVRRKSGEIFPEWLSFSTIRNGNNEVTHYLAIFSDITLQKASEERIQFLANYDPLTQLPNRLNINEQIQLYLKNGKESNYKLALLYLDIDSFKKINTIFGMEQGDKILQETAKRITCCLKSNEIVGRLGSDEFIIIMPKIAHEDEPTTLSQEVLDVMQEPFIIDNEKIFISLSIGISIFPVDSLNADDLFENASTALDHAKKPRHNKIQFYNREMNLRAKEYLILESNLYEALKNDEFRLYYQPLVNINSGQICGVEALMRWESKSGMISPSTFIPVAESSGLIIPLSKWALKTACLTSQEWLRNGLPIIPISVNITAAHFHQKDFKNNIARILKDTQLDPQHLKLEMTENVVMESTESTIKLLLELKEFGIHLSIDDFGTGYSSLSYLKKFPIDQLKIDQSFVRNLATDKHDREIIRAIINLAKSLRLTVVAEGVEDEEQFNFLRDEGCDIIQGYFFSKPIQSNELMEIVKKGKALS